MVEKDPGNEDGPSLEMPKLGFGFLRRRKRENQPEDTKAAAESDPDTIFDEDEQAEEPAERELREVPVEEPELADAPPAADTPVIASPAEELDSAPADESVDESADESAGEPTDETEAEPSAPEATSLTKTSETTAEAAKPAEETPDRDAEATTVLTDVPETEAAAPDEATEVLPGFSAAEPAADSDDQDEEQPASAAKPERTVSLPPLSGLTAAAVTGIAVGLLAVLLTFLALRGCEAARGTSSCGGPGLFLLIAIMVLCVLAGRFLLAAWNVTDPGSTSFLAVGLLAVIALLFLVNVLFEWWMIILIPLVALATFMLSHWVTTALIEPADR